MPNIIQAKKGALSVRIVKIFKNTITGPIVMCCTSVMTVCTAAEYIALIAIINHEKQGTNNINNNPLTTKF